MIDATRSLVREVLRSPHGREWSVQGFGMLRTYLDAEKRFRLNIWDSQLAVPGVSTIHDHPWHFTSLVINGGFSNLRYLQSETEGAEYNWNLIQTGPGGGKGEIGGVTKLVRQEPEHYSPGEMYLQLANEIHESFYADGTVTLNDRTRLPDGDHARVFWPLGSEWVDAMPRAATEWEVYTTIGKALSKNWGL